MAKADAKKSTSKSKAFSDVPDGVRRRMQAIKGKDTKPEKALRTTLHALGYRFRKNFRKVPGKPDVAFPSRRKAVFVHGCFWHQHDECQQGRKPQTRAGYWLPKLQRVVERDGEVIEQLGEAGWDALVVWECHLAAFPGRELEKVLSFVGPQRHSARPKKTHR